MSLKETQEALLANGFSPDYGTPAQYRAKVFKESEKLKEVAARSQITAD